MTEDRLDRARRHYERATFGGDVAALAAADRDLDAVEADLALARGRVAHARYLVHRTEDPDELALFERAVRLYRRLGDERGEAEALFWVGIVHQVIRDDDEAALPAFTRSAELAERVGDPMTLAYALRHLGITDHRAGRLDAARARLTESTRLRREIGFLPGVAANLVALAHLAVAEGDRDAARALLDEATELAQASDARAVLGWIAEARGGL
jgi:tetratricopeptide (TPR) repeat protein